ncbi:hypothetical protein CDAR_36501 [Caerostris darwini]|uniref:Uncharacterized protein n=1 Tax=Caerostris darwini TaxID=1538125 RepID=A0AAV4MBK2_9ARAC|nr:hypothetical protein CDAR_36501 [Caerostris darwini]
MFSYTTCVSKFQPTFRECFSESILRNRNAERNTSPRRFAVVELASEPLPNFARDLQHSKVFQDSCEPSADCAPRHKNISGTCYWGVLRKNTFVEEICFFPNPKACWKSDVKSCANVYGTYLDIVWMIFFPNIL